MMTRQCDQGQVPKTLVAISEQTIILEIKLLFFESYKNLKIRHGNIPEVNGKILRLIIERKVKIRSSKR